MKVWVVSDEGCNFCCRGKCCALNADDKFAKLGSYPKWAHRHHKTCSGIGGRAGSETKGEKSCPLRVTSVE
eukprot:9009256-Pyramimonas_sp.AAC.1